MPLAQGELIRATALFYMYRGEYDLMPHYLDQYSFEELKEVVYNHTCKVVERYADVVDWWEAINEGHTRYSNVLGLTRSQVTELVKVIVSAIKLKDPTAKIYINVASPLAEFMYQVHYPEPSNDYEMQPYHFLQDLIANGVDFDAIGIQFYYGSLTSEFFGDFGIPAIDLLTFDSVLELYKTLGKTILISEVEVDGEIPLNKRNRENGYWHDYWNSFLQAQWLNSVFSIGYSKDYIAGASWWDFTGYEPFTYHGGLIDANKTLSGYEYRQRPAYYTLQSLLKEKWYTGLQTKTDDSGSISLNGFIGNYTITVTKSGYVPYSEEVKVTSTTTQIVIQLQKNIIPLMVLILAVGIICVAVIIIVKRKRS